VLTEPKQLGRTLYLRIIPILQLITGEATRNAGGAVQRSKKPDVDRLRILTDFGAQSRRTKNRDVWPGINHMQGRKVDQSWAPIGGSNAAPICRPGRRLLLKLQVTKSADDPSKQERENGEKA
jgi:hypothetical protein